MFGEKNDNGVYLRKETRQVNERFKNGWAEKMSEALGIDIDTKTAINIIKRFVMYSMEFLKEQPIEEQDKEGCPNVSIPGLGVMKILATIPRGNKIPLVGGKDNFYPRWKFYPSAVMESYVERLYGLNTEGNAKICSKLTSTLNKELETVLKDDDRLIENLVGSISKELLTEDQLDKIFYNTIDWVSQKTLEDCFNKSAPKIGIEKLVSKVNQLMKGGYILPEPELDLSIEPDVDEKQDTRKEYVKPVIDEILKDNALEEWVRPMFRDILIEDVRPVFREIFKEEFFEKFKGIVIEPVDPKDLIKKLQRLERLKNLNDRNIMKSLETPIIEDTVTPIIEDTVTPIIEDTVTPIIEDIPISIEDDIYKDIEDISDMEEILNVESIHSIEDMVTPIAEGTPVEDDIYKDIDDFDFDFG
jgi:hypothetical protein